MSRTTTTTSRTTEIQRWSEVPAGSPLFETLYVFENYPDADGGSDSLRISNLRARQDLAATIAYIKNPKAPMPKMYPDLLDEKSVTAVANWIHEELR